MPGPCNSKKKRKTVNQKASKKSTKPETKPCVHRQSPSPSSSSPSHQLLQPNDLYAFDDTDQESVNEIPLPPALYIYDPGNGPRIRDTRAFLSSSYFAQKPAMHIPLCAEFAQPEIIEMLRTILPEETALILWYNKSRATSRICPACQRLYRLGDRLPDLAADEPHLQKSHDSPYLRNEQEISGLCSPVCFILASYNYPGAIKRAWGRTVDEIDDHTWEIMNGPGENNATGELGNALSMLVKMTRLHDLGLGQLCFGDEQVEAVELPFERLTIKT